jgi:hypothetical protein
LTVLLSPLLLNDLKGRISEVKFEGTLAHEAYWTTNGKGRQNGHLPNGRKSQMGGDEVSNYSHHEMKELPVLQRMSKRSELARCASIQTRSLIVDTSYEAMKLYANLGIVLQSRRSYQLYMEYGDSRRPNNPVTSVVMHWTIVKTLRIYQIMRLACASYSWSTISTGSL